MRSARAARPLPLRTDGHLSPHHTVILLSTGLECTGQRLYLNVFHKIFSTWPQSISIVYQYVWMPLQCSQYTLVLPTSVTWLLVPTLLCINLKSDPVLLNVTCLLFSM